MSSRVQLKIKDSGRVDAPAEVRFSLTVGLHEDDAAQPHEHSDGRLTVGEVGEAQEFGTDTIPSRSWLRAWADEQGAAVHSNIATALTALASKQQWTGPGGLRDVALKARNTIVQRIAKRIAPPLAESTLAKKTPKVVPLIDSRQFIDSISAQIQTNKGVGDTRGRRVNWDYKARGGRQ